jgi:hypothetical protein
MSKPTEQTEQKGASLLDEQKEVNQTKVKTQDEFLGQTLDMDFMSKIFDVIEGNEGKMGVSVLGRRHSEGSIKTDSNNQAIMIDVDGVMVPDRYADSYYIELSNVKLGASINVRVSKDMYDMLELNGRYQLIYTLKANQRTAKSSKGNDYVATTLSIEPICFTPLREVSLLK